MLSPTLTVLFVSSLFYVTFSPILPKTKKLAPQPISPNYFRLIDQKHIFILNNSQIWLHKIWFSLFSHILISDHDLSFNYKLWLISQWLVHFILLTSVDVFISNRVFFMVSPTFLSHLLSHHIILLCRISHHYFDTVIIWHVRFTWIFLISSSQLLPSPHFILTIIDITFIISSAYPKSFILLLFNYITSYILSANSSPCIIIHDYSLSLVIISPNSSPLFIFCFSCY